VSDDSVNRRGVENESEEDGTGRSYDMARAGRGKKGAGWKEPHSEGVAGEGERRRP